MNLIGEIAIKYTLLKANSIFCLSKNKELDMEIVIFTNVLTHLRNFVLLVIIWKVGNIIFEYFN